MGVAGIGNYILSETLFLAGVYPWARCGDLDEVAWHALHGAAIDVMQRSYTAQALLARGDADTANAGERRQCISATRGTGFAFKLYAYRQRATTDGLPVLQAEGPHGRNVFWVPQRQTRGRNTQ